MFSRRGAFDLTLNAVARAALSRPPAYDLTVSNPTCVGLPFDDEAVRNVVVAVDPVGYDPHPRGLPSARFALGEELSWEPQHLVLTATTSEAYSLLIKLFCDPGDHVLIPEPSYPLLSMLARLEGVRAVSYGYHFDGDWHLDRASFTERLTPRARLILGVSPNNPTGAFISHEDLSFLMGHGLPLVVDEVFAAYDLRKAEVAPLRHTQADEGLLFALGGLSKAAALPQLKLSWIAASGEPTRVAAALAQLDVITDTYLSPSQLAQLALPQILSGPSLERRQRIFERLLQNRRTALALRARAAEISVLPVQGGWYQVLRLPALMTEEQWVVALLAHGVLVQPGWFYDFPDQAWAVVSLLTNPEVFAAGLSRLGEVVLAELGADGVAD